MGQRASVYIDVLSVPFTSSAAIRSASSASPEGPFSPMNTNLFIFVYPVYIAAYDCARRACSSGEAACLTESAVSPNKQGVKAFTHLEVDWVVPARCSALGRHGVLFASMAASQGASSSSLLASCQQDGAVESSRDALEASRW